MLDTAPTVSLVITKDREYFKLLFQTKMVYDQLLRDKFSKLVDMLFKHKEQLDAHCSDIERLDGQEKALEFGVRAQEDLNRKQTEAEAELAALQHDYQSKLNKMLVTLEQQWLKDHSK